jgi:hypothetical protein
MTIKIEPKHLWLFNKLIIVDSREEALAEVFTEEYGDEATAIIAKSREPFPESIGYKTIHQLIGDSTPNEALEQAVIDTECKEASLIKHFFEKYGERAKELILKEAFEHGRRYGEDAITQYSLINSSPSGVYNILKNYLLDGWPPEIKKDPPRTEQPSGMEFIEHRGTCLHIINWKRVNAPIELLCDYTNRWIDGFAVKFTIIHERRSCIAIGDKVCEQVYTKKPSSIGGRDRIFEHESDRG